jgi:serine/threonine-protein kinase RsbW
MGSMVKAAQLRLELSSKAENVPVVRQALGGLAEVTGLSDADRNDIATAITEACNNASAHAYGGEEGPLEVELNASEAGMLVTVRDRGAGLTPDGAAQHAFPAEVDDELSGIGLPSIQALAGQVRWSEPAGGGTAVEMTFSTNALSWEGNGRGFEGVECVAIDAGALSSTIEVAMAPMAVAHRVLPRLLRVVAVQAGFSVQRHAQAQRVASALLADGCSWAGSDCIQARLVAGGDCVELAIGPLAEADTSRLADAACLIEPGLETSILHLGGGAQRVVVRLER